MRYNNVLGRIHKELAPRTYVEIGVRNGDSMQLALPGTDAIGIDPEPSLAYSFSGIDLKIASVTSDEYFSDDTAVRRDLKGNSIDFSFIDGMHLCEFALRDFINLERYSTSNSVIALHDGLPVSQATATRDRKTKLWSGDTWKTIVALRAYRPDLHVVTVDVRPTGLTSVSNLDPRSSVLSSRYEEIVECMMRATWDDYFGRGGTQPRSIVAKRIDGLLEAFPHLDRKKRDALGVIPCEWRQIRRIFPHAPWRRVADNSDETSGWRRMRGEDFLSRSLIAARGGYLQEPCASGSWIASPPPS